MNRGLNLPLLDCDRCQGRIISLYLNFNSFFNLFNKGGAKDDKRLTVTGLLSYFILSPVCLSHLTNQK